ncbi:MAG TPA: ferritin-like domain-containing protein [Kofleriaceae bacterium]
MEMGTGDIGILNFAYALEQLEAAFYTQVLRTPYAGMDRFEGRVLKDVRDHEAAHVAFLSKALGPKAIGAVPVNFSAINFADRTSVLKTAMTFENVGVSAYNGAAQFLKTPDYLVAAGRIVSVEARHAAAISDLLYPFSPAFAGDDVVDNLGLDVSRAPQEVAPLVQPYIAAPLVLVQS